LSYLKFNIRLTNTGSDPLEEYKVLLKFEGAIADMAKTNEEDQSSIYLVNKHLTFTTFLDTELKTGELIPRKAILVGDDTFTSEAIFIKPDPEETKIIITWKLISKDFKDEGELVINVSSEIVAKRNFKTVDDQSEVRRVEHEFEDFIEEKRD